MGQREFVFSGQQARLLKFNIAIELNPSIKHTDKRPLSGFFARVEEPMTIDFAEPVGAKLALCNRVCFSFVFHSPQLSLCDGLIIANTKYPGEAQERDLVGIILTDSLSQR